MKVKICGISNEIDTFNAINNGADLIGFVMGGKVLPIEVEPYAQNVRQIIKKFPKNVKSFLVTHLLSADDILALSQYINCTGIQVSEDIDEEEMKKVRKNFKGEIIKTIVSNYDDAEDKMKIYEKYCDYFLFDSRNSNYTGGTGVENDWEKTATLLAKTQKPCFIAGGLTPENVQTAINITNPFGVDVSTGVSHFSESYLKKDRKDLNKIKKFIELAKRN